MKKTALILALLLCLTGCSVVPLEEAAPPAAVQEETPPEVPEVQDTPEVSEEPGFEPVPLVSLGQVSAAVVDYAPDDPWGPTLTLELQNETESALRFSIENASSGGVMCDPYWSCEVPAGETVRSDVWWSGELMAKSGINFLQELVLDLKICQSGDETAVLHDGPVSLTLGGGEGDALTPPVWPEFPVQTLAEGKDFSIEAIGFSQEEGPALTLRLHNRRGGALLCTVTDVTVNGEVCDPGWGAVVMADAILYSEVVWETDAAVSEISMTLTVYDNEDWSAGTLFSETVQIILE